MSLLSTEMSVPTAPIRMYRRANGAHPACRVIRSLFPLMTAVMYQERDYLVGTPSAANGAQLTGVGTMLRSHDIASKLAAIRRAAARCAALPVLDSRSADEILGYDNDGLPS